MGARDSNLDASLQSLVDRAERAMQQGDGDLGLVDEAAQALAKAGETETAIALCVRYRAYAQAAEIAEAEEDHVEAAQLWFRAGNLAKSAESRARAGASTVAAELFERAGLPERAAAICESQHDFTRAAILWERAGNKKHAAELLWHAISDEAAQPLVGPEALEACRRAAVLFASVGQVEDAVRVLRFGGQTIFAGELLARAGRIEEALQLLVDAGVYLSAAQIAKDAGDERRAQLLLAERAENEGRLAEAAGHHEVVGDWAAAARLYEFGGDLNRCAVAHEKAGSLEMAGRIWQRLGDNEAATRCYRGAGKESDAEDLEATAHLDEGALGALVSEGRHLEAARAVLIQARGGDKVRYAEVETYLGRVPSGHPDNHAARAMLAEVLEEQGQTDRALDELQSLLVATNARPEHVPAFYQYGALQEHQGFLAGAREAFKTAATFDPGYRDVSERWARLKGADIGPDEGQLGLPEPKPEAPDNVRTMELIDEALSAMGPAPESGPVTPPPLLDPSNGLSDVTDFEALLASGPDQPAGLGANEDFDPDSEQTGKGPTYDPPDLKPEALVGRVLRGRFRIEKKLGRGSQAQVYLARDQVLDRKVAIKVLSEAVADDSKSLDRFLREARMAARVHHSGCLAIFDFGQEGGLTFMAMEYFRGRTLRDLIKKGPVDPYLALRLARDVAAALGAVHAAGIVHRDVKPTNMMVDRTGNVRLTDFGVAHTLGEDDSGGVMVGTMKYMAPEQARAKEVDSRADIFSLGVVIYEMLNGRPPFAGALDALIARVTKPPPPLPSTVNVSEEVRRIVRRCMAKSPKQRYAETDSLIEDLSSEISKLKGKRRARRRLAEETERAQAEFEDEPTGVFEHEVHTDSEPSTVLPVSALVSEAEQIEVQAVMELDEQAELQTPPVLASVFDPVLPAPGVPSPQETLPPEPVSEPGAGLEDVVELEALPELEELIEIELEDVVTADAELNLADEPEALIEVAAPSSDSELVILTEEPSADLPLILLEESGLPSDGMPEIFVDPEVTQVSDGTPLPSAVHPYPRLPPPMGAAGHPDLREELAIEAVVNPFEPKTRPPKPHTDDLILPGPTL